MGTREYSRSLRVADQLQRELADLISRSIDDPRVGLVTVSGVDLSPDMKNAKVLLTPSVDTDMKETIQALARASGYLRTQLGRRLRLRYLPRLMFVHDRTLENALHIDALIDSAAVADDGASEDR